jgi:hypothetical protein
MLLLTKKNFRWSQSLGWDIQNNKGDGNAATPRYKNVYAELTAGFKLY